MKNAAPRSHAGRRFFSAQDGEGPPHSSAVRSRRSSHSGPPPPPPGGRRQRPSRPPGGSSWRTAGPQSAPPAGRPSPTPPPGPHRWPPAGPGYPAPTGVPPIGPYRPPHCCPAPCRAHSWEPPGEAPPKSARRSGKCLHHSPEIGDTPLEGPFPPTLSLVLSRVPKSLFARPPPKGGRRPGLRNPDRTKRRAGGSLPPARRAYSKPPRSLRFLRTALRQHRECAILKEP